MLFANSFCVGQYFWLQELGDFVLCQNFIEENFLPLVLFAALSAFQKTIFKGPHQSHFVTLFQVLAVNGKSNFVLILGIAVVQVVFVLQKLHK